MSTENDAAPAAPADHAEKPQEVTAPVVEDHDAAPAEADEVTAPAPASPETASAPAAEEVVEATPEPTAPGAEESEAPGAEEAAPAAPAKTELSPAQCAAHLAEMFPALFGTQGPPKPIKLRIQADLQQRAPGLFTRKALSIVLHRHTTSTPYLKALVAAPSRFDLDGEPAGEIAEEHRQAAREEVERRLRALIRTHAPRRLLIVGDLVEDRSGAPAALALLERLRAVTPDNILAVAREIIDPSRLTIAVVGPNPDELMIKKLLAP
jgi:hypothetical protein